MGLDAFGIGAVGQREAAVEAAVAALGDVIVLLLLLGLLALLALDGETAIGELDVDVLLVEAGKLGRDLVGFVAFGDVDGRGGARLGKIAFEPCKRLERPVPEAVAEILKNLVDFVAQRRERLSRFGSGGRSGRLCHR